MAAPSALDIFLAAPPGLEPLLAEEARDLGFPDPSPVPGGVLTSGPWPEVWRANLLLRGAGRVLVRVGSFRALHLAQLDKRARRLDWLAILRPGEPVRVDATCEGSRIWHKGAAAERVAGAAMDATGGAMQPDAAARLLVRIVDDLCTISLDTSGEPLHRRGTKQAVGKAPLRETLAALFLHACGYRGTEPVLDPMCGSGTIVLEAAEIAVGLAPGRSRPFAFERLASFDPEAWAALRAESAPRPSSFRFTGFDRDAGAVAAARANADRAGLANATTFAQAPISALQRPEGPPGLVLVNPPYGERIGDKADLRALYATLGRVLAERFAGWRVGLVTSEPALAHATGLQLRDTGAPVPHGKLRIRLHRTDPLP
jgi:putative N6-adenine-specific DNA methylase